MIPKIIHYCWLSKEDYPENIRACINSWKIRLSDFEFKLWTLDDFDINSNEFIKEAFKNKKYAFVADYVRFYALSIYGGIYLDSDVEVVKSFEPLLQYKSFMGFDYEDSLEPAIIGAEKNLPWVNAVLETFATRVYYNKNEPYLIPLPVVVKSVLETYFRISFSKYKHVTLPDLKLFPYRFFSPKNPYTAKYKIFNDTYCVHQFSGAWLYKGFKFKIKKCLHLFFLTLFGRKVHNSFFHFYRFLKKKSLVSKINS